MAAVYRRVATFERKTSCSNKSSADLVYIRSSDWSHNGDVLPRVQFRLLYIVHLIPSAIYWQQTESCATLLNIFSSPHRVRKLVSAIQNFVKLGRGCSERVARGRGCVLKVLCACVRVRASVSAHLSNGVCETIRAYLCFYGFADLCACLYI